MAYSPRVCWFISGGRDKASSRLQGYLIDEYLRSQNWKSDILIVNSEKIPKLYDAKNINSLRFFDKNGGYDVAIFEAPEWPMYKLSNVLRFRGVKTIAVRCDYYPGPYDEYFDLVITPTDSLGESLGIKNYVAIPDAVEAPRGIYKTIYKQSSKKIKVTFFGHEGYIPFVDEIICRINNNSNISGMFEFVKISRGPLADIQWDEVTIFNNLIKSDIVFIPLPSGEWYRNKSHNRLALVMALGIPSVASPLKSYSEIATHGENTLFFRDDSELIGCLEKLTSESERKRLGTNAHQALGNIYSVFNIGQIWKDSIMDLVVRNGDVDRVLPRIAFVDSMALRIVQSLHI